MAETQNKTGGEPWPGAGEVVFWTLQKDDHKVVAIGRPVHAEMEVRLERDGTSVQVKFFDSESALKTWLDKRRQELAAAGWV